MKALKLFAPLLILLLLVVAAVLFLRYLGDRPPSDPQDLSSFATPETQPMAVVDPAHAFPAAKEAFSLSNSHMEVDQEWWYFNTHLIDEKNRRYTFMIAILKNGQVFGSLSLLDQETHIPFFAKTVVDVDPANRLVSAEWCSLQQPNPEAFEYDFTFEHDVAKIYLHLKANKLPLPVGGEGYIAMGESGKSYYYSLTNMSVEGFGEIRGAQAKFRGRGWMDRQWGIWEDRDFDQWHWYSIQLTNNVEIMIFDFRRNGKSITPLCEVVDADGNFRHNLKFNLRVLGHWKSPRTKKVWSSGWQIEIPELNAHLTVVPDMQNQEVTDALWEGGCRVSGTYEGHNVWGRSFYEARHRSW